MGFLKIFGASILIASDCDFSFPPEGVISIEPAKWNFLANYLKVENLRQQNLFLGDNKAFVSRK